MQGFVDQTGAPTFSSSFVAAHDGSLVREQDGVLHVRVPGTITHSNKSGNTTYRAALEVYALRDASSAGTPVKIQRHEQITCLGKAAACE